MTLAAIAVLHWRDLDQRYVVDPPADPHSPDLLWIAAGVCAVIGPAFADTLPAPPVPRGMVFANSPAGRCGSTGRNGNNDHAATARKERLRTSAPVLAPKHVLSR